MNKFKIILSYILGFVISVLLLFLSILVILKLTVYNKNSLFKKLESVNYYESVYNEISKDMKNNLLSSGLDETVLNKLYTKNDVKKDVNNMISAIYSGSKYKVSTDSLKEKLYKNVDEFLKSRNVELENKSSLDSFINAIIKVYENEVNLYGYFGNYANKFVKIGNVLDISIAVTILLILSLIIIVKYVLNSKLGVVLFSCSLMIFYLRYFIYAKIDYKNILIISNSFSDVLRKILSDIDNYILTFGFIYLFAGVMLIIKNSFKKNKRRKKIS